MSSSEYPDYVAQNVAVWTRANEKHTGPRARDVWAQEEITWGVFEISEREVDALGDVAGLDIVELGCGTAYFSAWLASAARDRWASIQHPRSSQPRARCSRSSASSSR